MSPFSVCVRVCVCVSRGSWDQSLKEIQERRERSVGAQFFLFPSGFKVAATGSQSSEEAAANAAAGSSAHISHLDFVHSTNARTRVHTHLSIRIVIFKNTDIHEGRL